MPSLPYHTPRAHIGTYHRAQSLDSRHLPESGYKDFLCSTHNSRLSTPFKDIRGYDMTHAHAHWLFHGSIHDDFRLAQIDRLEEIYTTYLLNGKSIRFITNKFPDQLCHTDNFIEYLDRKILYVSKIA